MTSPLPTESFAVIFLAAMRNEFGGHQIKKE
jgi:6-phosphogluconate dehydrogenase (decarboxylating)